MNPFDKALWAVYPLMYDRLWDTGLTAEAARAVTGQVPVDMPVEEVGAGTGLVTQHLVDAGLAVTVSEPNSRMRKRLTARLPCTPLRSAPLDDLPPPSETPQSIVAANVVHLTSDPTKAVDALRRRAGVGGRAVIVTPAANVTLVRVARAHRACGESRRSVLRFILLHGILSPLTTLAGAAVSRRSLASVKDDEAIRSECVRGVSQVIVFGGLDIQAGERRS
jgi:SAM-dependent methyltransferase